MIFKRLCVFVSSKMQELAPERQALKSALDELKVDAWVFEQDAGARPESIQKTFLNEVEAADLYIGLFWRGYGDYTIEEYEHARKRGKDCLVYEKRDALNGQRDPRLQAFLDRLSNVETGVTIRWFDDSLELTDLIKDDLQRLQAKIYRERSTPRINVNLSLAEKKERDELLKLIRKVKEFWVEGVLEKSIHGQALIDLGKEAWTEQTEHPWEQVLELPDQTSRTLPAGEPIDKIFADIGRSLLILGAPGSGKTITLLVLARELIGLAQNDPSQPIPVIFNLSSWNGPNQNLLDWLVDELQVKYQVPKKIGSRWLEANWIVPLLDGLDEVMRANWAACVEAVNTYVQNIGSSGLVVCSRLKEYTDLPVRLKVAGAICLQPLRREQVKGYVARSGDALAGLRAAMDKDPVLETLAETPLMLEVMTLAYRDLPAEELTNEALNTEPRRAHVFNTYIAKMFTRKGKREQVFAREHTLSCLIWLARSMLQHGQTVFLIDQLQPSWLTTSGQRTSYILGSRMVFGLLVSLIFGIIIGVYTPAEVRFVGSPAGLLPDGLTNALIAGLIGGLTFGLVPGLVDLSPFLSGSTLAAVTEKLPPRWQTGVTILLYSLILGLIGWLIFGLIFFGLFRAPTYLRHTSGEFGLLLWLFSGLSGIFWGLRSRYRNLTTDIQNVETLRWSWMHGQKGYVQGVIIGMVLGVIFVLYETLTPEPGVEWHFEWQMLGGVLLGGPLLGLIPGVVMTGPICGMFRGFRVGILEVKSRPNLGIKLSLRNALLTGGLGLLVFGLIFMVPIWLISLYFPDDYGLLPVLAVIFGTTFGMILGVMAFLQYGGQDVIQHYILRFILYWKGHTPLQYAKFLNYAARLLFLQKVGGGYIFIHRLLLEHFAAAQKVNTVLDSERRD